MTTKKASSKSSGARSAKKTGTAHAAASSKRSPKRTAQSTGKKDNARIGRKTKQVMGAMLTGAAVGAIKGAAEAIDSPKAQGNGGRGKGK